ncbi:hypothetical protein [Streptomyces sp. NPDC048473]|uniref:hypothetical protein n=1 Tax=unclassified Streptomyces TaxID=2593676 RepID=UPI003721E4B9
MDLDTPREQRHTVTRIFHRLVEEHGADVFYGMVRCYGAGRKPEILVDAKNAVARLRMSMSSCSRRFTRRNAAGSSRSLLVRPSRSLASAPELRHSGWIGR